MGRLNKFQKFVKEFLEQDDSVKLSHTSALTDLDQLSSQAISAMYESKNPSIKKGGSIINSAYTHGTSVFLLSMRIVSELIKNDGNVVYNGCNSRNYKEIMHKMLKDGVISVLRPPSGRLAGLYEINSELFLIPLQKKIGKKALENKRLKNIAWYDKTSLIRDKKIQKDIEEGKEMRKKYEKRNGK